MFQNSTVDAIAVLDSAALIQQMSKDYFGVHFEVQFWLHFSVQADEDFLETMEVAKDRFTTMVNTWFIEIPLENQPTIWKWLFHLNRK